MDLHKEEDESKKVGKDKPVYKASEPSTVQLVFKYNRRMELYVGREMFIFEPHEEKSVPAEVVKHPDFIAMKSYFVVKEK
jgi:hypothetical protein